ncbi:uncharacterized protein At5g39865 [Magnolia sinica]|uniref:uncharacterized protein At5g39865 n=1 Tax=Magnolia sinica TaxID=86752 RepID=UPI00265A9C42|nr:uncharacterized protein At5g39865 [Magnolia sinica]
MWWGKSPLRTPSLSHSRSHSFTFSTFKDIQTLCEDDSFPDTSERKQPHLRRSPSIFHRVRIASSTLRARNSLLIRSDATHPESHRIVVYFTSLRVVRSTFEDCRTVRTILRGFRVSIDERDLSMDVAFLDELKGILGNRNLTLPRVFIGGRYIGGAEEILQLHESGELKKIVEGFPKAEIGVCDGCGGFRFLLCGSCSGSHKCFSEKGGFRSCSVCNENGLVRCPECC